MELVELGRVAKGLPSVLRSRVEGHRVVEYSEKPFNRYVNNRLENKALGTSVSRYKKENNKAAEVHWKNVGADKRLENRMIAGEITRDQRLAVLKDKYKEVKPKRTRRTKAQMQSIGKNDLVSERVKAGMAPSPISAPARAKNGRLLNLASMGDRQPVLGRGKPFRNGKVVP